MTVLKRNLPRGWYPVSAEQCVDEIDGFLKGFQPPEGQWTAGIVPHAGWYYSGSAAARVISTIAMSSKPDRVVIYGGHLPGNREPVVYTEEAWETPLGRLELDSGMAADLVAGSAAVPAYSGFSDNTVEIQLPLVKHFFPGIPVIAVHSPSSSGAVKLADALNEALKKRNLSAVFIGSADLTHYGPNYGFSPHGIGPDSVKWVKTENDRSLIDKILLMDVQGVLQDAKSRRSTCSAGPIVSSIRSASSLGIKKGHLLEYYTSFDVSPDSSFVGYAGILF